MHYPVLLVLLAACGAPGFETDTGQLSISDPEVIDIQADDGGPSPFLAGMELCPEISANLDTGSDDDYDALACFNQAFEGPVTLVGECLAFEAPGVVDWTFTARARGCPGNDFGYVPTDDHVAIEVLAAADVEGHLPMLLEEFVEDAEGQAGVAVTRPDGWRIADGATWRIVAEQAFNLQPRLRTRADGAAVAWKDGTLVSGGGATVVAQGELGVYRVFTTLGETSTLSLEVGGESIRVGQVEGVPVSAVASLEIAMVQVQSAAAGTSSPFAARAVVRDAAGELVMGAPVRWSFTPLLLVSGADSLPGPDYVVFSDQCTDPASTFGEQRARLTASVGLVSDGVDVVWTPRTEASPQEGWVASEDCQTSACGCTTGGPTQGGLAMLLGLLALVRRRRGA
ncbi:MAG: MYXO-CTERM sorting domain-containing protein [Pseudomonadota bacterium]|nr:MYXO-CTERM sorting domain-containing protein [Pseudomonadota bacterium]